MNYLLKPAITFFTLLLFNQLLAQDQNNLNPFTFRVVSTPGFVELQAEEGCDWLTLSFSLWESGDPVIINQEGMLGSDVQKMEEHHAQSIFLFKIDRTTKGFKLTSYKGTEWTELETDCLEEYCSFQIDEEGLELFED